jgi:hypothetical protein
MRRQSNRFSRLFILTVTLMTAAAALGGIALAGGGPGSNDLQDRAFRLPRSPIGKADLEDLARAKDKSMWLAGFRQGLQGSAEKAAAARISYCFPAYGVRGRTMPLLVVGSNTNFKEGVSKVTFSGGGITVNSTTVVDKTDAIAEITISPNAVMGGRDVNVITGSKAPAPLKGGFKVTNPSSYFAE